MILSLHKQPFVTAHSQFITAHFVRHCALKNALPYVRPFTYGACTGGRTDAYGCTKNARLRVVSSDLYSIKYLATCMAVFHIAYVFI